MKYVKTFELYRDYDIDSVGNLAVGNLGGYPNNKKQLLAYIEAGGDIDVIDKNGNTPLIRSVTNSKSELTNILIKSGADLNIQNNNGETALMKATKNRDVMRYISLLIDAGADWNIEKYDKFLSSVENPISYRDKLLANIDFFEMLTPKYQELTKEKYPEKYNYYLSKKESSNSNSNSNLQNNKGDTALIYAVKDRNIKRVESLIKSGANLNIQNNKGETALIIAARYLNMNIIYKLIEAGSDWNITKYKDNTILSFNSINGGKPYTPRGKFYEEKDFFEILSPKYQEILKEKYPEKYAKYLAKK